MVSQAKVGESKSGVGDAKHKATNLKKGAQPVKKVVVGSFFFIIVFFFFFGVWLLPTFIMYLLLINEQTFLHTSCIFALYAL